MNPIPLTATQIKVLRFLARCVRESGVPPSYRELGAEFGWTPNGVAWHLVKLEQKGFIKRDHNRARAIEFAKCWRPRAKVSKKGSKA